MPTGSDAFLRPALKYGDTIYVAPFKGQHLDALPPHLIDEFKRQAMSGEDISGFDFGFINDNGEFMNRKDALMYAIDKGVLNPNDAQYVTLTSTMLNENAQRGKAIEDLAEGDPAEIDRLVRDRNWNVGG